MVLRYNELILESLIKESVLYYSDELGKILKKIQSPIAKDLIKILKTDVDKLSNNYIDVVSDVNDEVSFTTVAKIKQTYARRDDVYIVNGIVSYISDQKEYPNVWSKLELDKEDLPFFMDKPEYLIEPIALIRKVYDEENGCEWGFFRSLSNNKPYVLELNYDSLKKPTSDTYNPDFYTKSRNKIKIGRFVRSILRDAGLQYTDKNIEDFVNMYKAAIDSKNNIDSNFELVSGEDIKYWYNEDQYEDGDGTLNQSCMKDGSCEDYFQIYSDCDGCHLLILKTGEELDKIVGRALVWTTTNGFTYMDRVYTCEDHYVQVFRNYAQRQGWYYKKTDNSNENTPLIKPNGDEFIGEIRVKVMSGGYDKYPYVDTIKFYYVYQGILSNVMDKDVDCVELSDTEGNVDNSDYGCHICHGDNGGDCPDCDGDGHTTEDCDDCSGTGREPCTSCDSTGTEECPECDGKGKDDDDNECDVCSGEGTIECIACDGEKYEACSTCDGSGTQENECSRCDGSGSIQCNGNIHDIVGDND